jgi:8-oxo-dGTP diphosphatase
MELTDYQLTGCLEAGMAYHILPDVLVIVRRENLILFNYRINTGFMDHHYSLIGGRVEPGETIEAAAQREVHEEIGLRVTQTALNLVHVLQKFALQDRVSFVFETWLSPDQEPSNLEPALCGHLRWAESDNPPQPLVPSIPHLLEQIALGRRCSAFHEG